MSENDHHPPWEMDAYWEKRTLCDDEACIGVIGEDGRCRECGKPFSGDLKAPGSESENRSEKAQDDEKIAAAPERTKALADENAAGDNTDAPDDFNAYWKNRRLCGDEACIGVIGEDGRCRECGKVL